MDIQIGFQTLVPHLDTGCENMLRGFLPGERRGLAGRRSGFPGVEDLHAGVEDSGPDAHGLSTVLLVQAAQNLGVCG
jgi:hypothetical protein